MHKYVYKTVSLRHGKFYSYLNSRLLGNYTIQYDLHKTSLPTVGPIFAFKDAISAKRLILASDNGRYYGILKCEYKPLEYNVSNVLNLILEPSCNIKSFWRNLPNPGRLVYDKWIVPSLTVACSELTPIEVVDERYIN